MNEFVGGLLVGAAFATAATTVLMHNLRKSCVRRLDQALRVSHDREALLRDVLDAASEWVWQTDDGHRLVRVDCIDESLSSLEAIPYRGRRRDEIADRQPGDGELWASHYRDLEARRSFRDLRYRLRDTAGNLHEVRVSGKPAFDPDGVFIGYRGISVDVTAEVEAEKRAEQCRALMVDALRQARDTAEQANHSKTRFLAAASHDLRQPLQALGLFVATLSQRDLPSDLRKIVDRIESSLEALEHLLDTLLDMSRLDAGVVRAHMANFPLQSLFDRLEGEFAPLAENKGLSIRFRPTPQSAYSDPALLERILRNLLTNAIRYTAQGGILVAVRRRGEGLHIQVWDTGKGIPADQQVEVFREFHQIGGELRDRRQGLGLGLAIVDRLAGLLDHDIVLRSRLGHGSCFSVVVPPARRGEPPFQTVPDAELLSRRLVVVVDDDASARDSVSSVLQLWGCRTVAAEDLPSAMAAIEQAGEMPGAIVARSRRGVAGDVIAALRERLEEDVPAVLIGDLASPSEQSDKLQLLHNPVTPETLQRALKEALKSAQMVA